MSEIVIQPPAPSLPAIPSTSPTLGIPKFRVPFEMTVRGAATVEQDSLDEVVQCVFAVLATEIGSRIEEPDFGVPDMAFVQGGADLEELENAVETWEDRAEMLTEVEWDALLETVTQKVGLAE